MQPQEEAKEKRKHSNIKDCISNARLQIISFRCHGEINGALKLIRRVLWAFLGRKTTFLYFCLIEPIKILSTGITVLPYRNMIIRALNKLIISSFISDDVNL